MNPITGEKTLDICGHKVIMRFDWQALSEVEQRFGDKPDLFKPEIVAGVAEIGLRARHPEMTAERIMKLSPPVVPFANAVQQAIQWAYFGPEAVKDLDDSKKKNAPRPDGLWRRFTQRLRQAFRL